MTTDHTMRDGMIHNARETRRADDTKILQKVNAANREAFLVRFPGQLEHCMRLISERLQFCLSKPEHMVLHDPMSWPATPTEIAALSEALHNLEQVRRTWPITGDA
jgi:hypothetical protein